MAKASVELELSESLIAQIDTFVREGLFASRSDFIERALTAQLATVQGKRLGAAAAQLDPVEERALAEERMAADRAAWPAY